MSTVPQTEPAAADGPPSKLSPSLAEEEVDVWLGSYSGWTMIPSLVVCILLTGLIAWFSWATFRGGRSGVVQLTFLSLAGGVWLLQTLRWAYRSCAYNYRLTNKRLFRDLSFGTRRRKAVDLKDVARVFVRESYHEKLAGVGRVIITLQEPRKKLVLGGVRNPHSVAELIEAYVKKAQVS